jgi:hypothetical protein
MALKEGAKEVGQGVKEGITETKREAQKQGQTIGEWFRDTGKKTADGFRQMGRDIRKIFTGNQDLIPPATGLPSFRLLAGPLRQAPLLAELGEDLIDLGHRLDGRFLPL